MVRVERKEGVGEEGGRSGQHGGGDALDSRKQPPHLRDRRFSPLTLCPPIKSPWPTEGSNGLHGRLLITSRLGACCRQPTDAGGREGGRVFLVVTTSSLSVTFQFRVMFVYHQAPADTQPALQTTRTTNATGIHYTPLPARQIVCQLNSQPA